MKSNPDYNQTWSPFGGVYQLTFDGQKWNKTDSALSGNYITSLVASGHNIFAGTYTGGIFASSDDGTTWRSISDGLTDMSIGSLEIKGAMLFIATSSGVWKRPLSEVTSVPKEKGLLPNDYGLVAELPKSLQPHHDHPLCAPGRSHVTLTVFNTARPKGVATLVNESHRGGVSRGACSTEQDWRVGCTYIDFKQGATWLRRNFCSFAESRPGRAVESGTGAANESNSQMESINQ